MYVLKVLSGDYLRTEERGRGTERRRGRKRDGRRERRERERERKGLQDPCDNMKLSSILVIGVPEETD
jgi:hypothetical protein